MSAMSNMEIDQVEQSLGVTLPGLYRRLLTELGPGRVGSSAELYDPLLVRELYEPFFDDPSALFLPYFPFGCNNGEQQVWVIDAAAERAASIWHETVPDDWPDEEWLEYDEWARRYLDGAADA